MISDEQNKKSQRYFRWDFLFFDFNQFVKAIKGLKG